MVVCGPNAGFEDMARKLGRWRERTKTWTFGPEVRDKVIKLCQGYFKKVEYVPYQKVKED